jgi:hypothetical protein
VNARRAPRSTVHPVCRSRAARGICAASGGRRDSEGSEVRPALPGALCFPTAWARPTFTRYRNNTATHSLQPIHSPASARFGSVVMSKPADRWRPRASAARIRSSSHRGLDSVPGPARSNMVRTVLSLRSEARCNHSLKPTRYGSHRLAAPGHSGHCPSAASRRLPQRAA